MVLLLLRMPSFLCPGEAAASGRDSSGHGSPWQLILSTHWHSGLMDDLAGCPSRRLCPLSTHNIWVLSQLAASEGLDVLSPSFLLGAQCVSQFVSRETEAKGNSVSLEVWLRGSPLVNPWVQAGSSLGQVL